MRNRFDWDQFFINAMWALDTLSHPARYQPFLTFEGWCYANRHWLGVEHLVRLGYLESDVLLRRRRLRLAPKARRLVEGEVKPLERWDRAWDGQWRAVVFDLPVHEQPRRVRLLRWLREKRFGHLQDSVWITPDPLRTKQIPLGKLSPRPGLLLLLSAQPEGKGSKQELVRAAWNFDAVRTAYETHAEVLREGETLLAEPWVRSSTLAGWMKRERVAWLAACASDPFLPRSLLPPDYPGCDAYQRRKNFMTRLAGKAGLGPAAAS